MKKQLRFFLIFCVSHTIYSMQITTAYNNQWFYNPANKYRRANLFQEYQEWTQAEMLYRKLLHDRVGTLYDQQMARINSAICKMAQREPSDDWAVYDKMLNIPKQHRISSSMFNNTKDCLQSKSILVRTDGIDNGTILYFVQLPYLLKNRTSYKVIFSVPNILQEKLLFFKDISDKDISDIDIIPEDVTYQQRYDYITHLISLIGHLHVLPRTIASSSSFCLSGGKISLFLHYLAQKKMPEGGTIFDELSNIPKNKLPSQENILTLKKEECIAIKSDGLNSDSVISLLSLISNLKKSTQGSILFYTTSDLKKQLFFIEKNLNISLLDNKNIEEVSHYTTHLVSLFYYLKKSPYPSQKTHLSESLKASIDVITNFLFPLLHSRKKIVLLFLGEKTPVTLLGGRTIPTNVLQIDTKDAHDRAYGKHLASEPFKTLMNKNKDMVIVDCGNKNSRPSITEDMGNQYLLLPEKDDTINSLIACAFWMNINESIIAIGADCDESRILSSFLIKDAKTRMGLIIPNAFSTEYDVFMENYNSSPHTHMISGCMVYKYHEPHNQNLIVQEVYTDLIRKNR